jgi:hypothetical protein
MKVSLYILIGQVEKKEELKEELNKKGIKLI